MATPYLVTPWGLFTQQQFMLLLIMQYMCHVSADFADSGAYDDAFTTVYDNFYQQSWPRIKALNLNI